MRERGFKLVEFAVVVMSIGILAGLLLGRVMPLIGLALEPVEAYAWQTD